ncbi:MAG: universal stress protein [Cytophagales bacterium]|nr:universal stress protein [Cytophagales bacterium]
MFQTILIPTDFTPAAWKAMYVGVALGESHKSHLTLLHVYPNSDKFSKEKLTKDISDELKKIKDNMEKMSKEIAQEKGLKISSVVLSGNVEEQLISFVKEHPTDLVIMGVNSNGDDNNPGSHTVEIIQQSSAPLLIVPNSYSIDE